MIENYLKISFRNLWRHKVLTFINVMGVEVGMTACFLIYQYVTFGNLFMNFAILAIFISSMGLLGLAS